MGVGVPTTGPTTVWGKYTHPEIKGPQGQILGSIEDLKSAAAHEATAQAAGYAAAGNIYDETRERMDALASQQKIDEAKRMEAAKARIDEMHTIANQIAETKMKDLNANSVEAAMQIILGSAKSCGIEVKG